MIVIDYHVVLVAVNVAAEIEYNTKQVSRSATKKPRICSRLEVIQSYAPNRYLVYDYRQQSIVTFALYLAPFYRYGLLQRLCSEHPAFSRPIHSY